MQTDTLKDAQYGSWLRAGSGWSLVGENKESKMGEGEIGRLILGKGEERVENSLRERSVEAKEEGNGKIHEIGRKEDGDTIAANIGVRKMDKKIEREGTGIGEGEKEEGTNCGDIMIVDFIEQEKKGEQGECSDIGVQKQITTVAIPASRKPLRDCTNSLLIKERSEGLEDKGMAKGQWKKKARMQGQKLDERGKETLENLMVGNRKIDRLMTEPDQELMEVMTIGKKRKIDWFETKLGSFEVEETSREWSQAYK